MASEIDKNPNCISSYMKAIVKGGEIEDYPSNPIQHASKVHNEFKDFPISDNNEALSVNDFMRIRFST